MDELKLPPSDLTLLRTEVLDKPPSAALPCHLPDHWLLWVARDCDEALSAAAAEPERTCMVAPAALILHLLSARVYEEPLFVPTELMYRYFCDYRAEVALELVGRRSNVSVEAATMETIFTDRDVHASLAAVCDF